MLDGFEKMGLAASEAAGHKKARNLSIRVGCRSDPRKLFSEPSFDLGLVTPKDSDRIAVRNPTAEGLDGPPSGNRGRISVHATALSLPTRRTRDAIGFTSRRSRTSS